MLQDDPAQLTHQAAAPSQELVYDTPDVRGRRETAPVQAAASVLEVENPLGVVRERVAREKVGDQSPPTTFSSPMSIRDLLTEPLFDEPGDEHVWARGRDYRASFGPEGFSFLPVFGRQSPREFPVTFSLGAVTIGGEALPTTMLGVSRDGTTVTLDQGSLREVYHVGLDQTEQTFVFDQLPGIGDLVVEMTVDTELTATSDANGLHFVHPTLGHVTYGNAFVFDADGARQAIERTWFEGSLRLTVPASFLAGAVLPVTIDPPVTGFSNSFGAADDFNPDITYAGRSNDYWVVWQDYTSATNSDVYATSFNTVGTQGATLLIDITSDHWEHPAVAYHYGSDRLLVVASQELGGMGGSGTIQGRFVDATAASTIGFKFTISTVGFRKLWPDVGGNNWDSTTNAYFCVVWSFEATATNRNPQYRVVDWDGTMMTSVTTVSLSTDDDIHTTISESHGDGDLIGDWWTMAWTSDATGNGLGQIWARRVVWSGNGTFGAGTFLVEAATNCEFPSVTSRLDDFLVAEADRPSIVAYSRLFGGPQRSVYARVVTDGTAYANNYVSTILEDVDLDLDQFGVSVATDGNAFYMTYSEEYHGGVGTGDWDMYMLSGHLSQTTNDVHLALAERHQNLGFVGVPEWQSRVCTIWDGESNSTSDDGCAIWTREGAANGGTLYGSTLEVPTIDTSPRIAVGRQFCDANGNASTSPYSAEVSSWMWIEGTQSNTSTHTMRCVDVTPNAAGYLIASRNTINVNLPGGSAGRICLGGAGRYVNAVQNSGSSGTYSTIVNPLSIPTPTGFVSALPGDTWHFQYWHRDIQGGLPTSNFSTACSVMFAP